MALLIAEAIGLKAPSMSPAAVSSSIVPTRRDCPSIPNTPSQLTRGLCWIKGAMPFAAYDVNFSHPNHKKMTTSVQRRSARWVNFPVDFSAI